MTATKPSSRATIVPASAGSGKTYRLAHEYIYDTLRNRYDDNGRAYFDHTIYKRILAVTFTNKATEEMKSRILSTIHELASGKECDHLKDLIKETSLSEQELRSRAKIVRSAILHDYSHFTVLTNDTFFQRILRAFVRELGIDLNFSTELDTAPIVIRSVDAIIEDITTDATLRKWLEELTEERVNEGEKWNIREAILTLEKSLFNEATHDIISNLSDKESLRNKVFGLRKRATDEAGKISKKAHQACEYITSHGYSHSNFSHKFTSYFETLASGKIVAPTKTVAGHMSDSTTAWFNKNCATPELLRIAEYLQGVLCDIYNDLLEYETLNNTLVLLMQNYRSLALLYDLQKKVHKLCNEDNKMLLSETRHTIARFISEAEAPFIYEKVGSYFDKFMIDEFQDTSAKEWHNFLPLLRNAMAQSDEQSVLIVGDVKQSIYRWRGGDWRILGSRVAKDLRDVAKVPLGNNWRSLPAIVDFNNDLFAAAVDIDNRNLNTMLNDAKSANRLTKETHGVLYNMLRDAYLDLKQEPKRKHINRGFVSIDSFSNKNTEASKRYIQRIREVLDMGYRPCDITILVRYNKEAVQIANELIAARSSFPAEQQFEITTEEALNIASSQAVQFIIALLRLAINRKDTASLTIYNSIHNHNQFGNRLNEEEMKFLDQIRVMPLEEAFEHIIMRYETDIEGETAYIQALHECIVSFSAGKVSDIALFDRWWREKSSKLSVHTERSERAIEIMTIHKAKGLENKVIIIPMCNWNLSPKISRGYTTNIVWAEPQHNDPLSELGAFPLRFGLNVKDTLFADGYYQETVYAHIDNINLLYVALTRAGEQLHIFVPRSITYNTGTLLLESIPKNAVRSEITTGNDEEGNEEKIIRYTIGDMHAPEPKEEKAKDDNEKVEMAWLTDYNASPVNIKMRTSASRYFSDEATALTPRSMGIKLHRLFEDTATREDIAVKLRNMVADGDITAADITTLEQHINSALDNTVAGEWFDGSWERVLHERSIIRPKDRGKRPDRVMLKGKCAVVVDYKFGAMKDNHISQIKSYKEELCAMGYTDVRGYLWYVAAEKIVEVDN